MSERMIELQRARLLGAKGSNGGTPASTPTQNGSQKIMSGQAPGSLPVGQAHQTPQQAAAAAVRLEDLQMQRFFHRLQARDDTRPDASSGPTVPTALSRRILQKQGVGYLDDTVAAVVSASADRFLATVLHQAAACRDQRLKGAELAREAARHRKRHMQHYEADSDDRQRRKEEKEKKREKANIAAVEAAEVLTKSGKTPAKEGEPTATKSKKKKKVVVDDSATNGRKPKPQHEEDDDDSYDSVDEEEDYYRNYYGDGNVNGGKDDDEEDDETLILRDIARPLEAWDFHLTGKEGMYHRPEASEDEADISDEEEDNDDSNMLDVSQEMGENEASTQEAAKSPSKDKGDKKPSADDKASKGSLAPTTIAAS
jgi:hypothetical protein